MRIPSLSIPFVGNADDDDDFQIPSGHIPSSPPATKRHRSDPAPGKENDAFGVSPLCGLDCREGWGGKGGKNGYFVNSIESRLLAGGVSGRGVESEEVGDEDFVLETQLDELIGLCSEDCVEGREDGDLGMPEEAAVDGCVECPLCGSDISYLSEDLRQIHTNECLDRDEDSKVSNFDSVVKINCRVFRKMVNVIRAGLYKFDFVN